MSNPNMESQIKELLELKRMKEELEAEIAQQEDAIKSVMVDRILNICLELAAAPINNSVSIDEIKSSAWF